MRAVPLPAEDTSLGPAARGLARGSPQAPRRWGLAAAPLGQLLLAGAGLLAAACPGRGTDAQPRAVTPRVPAPAARSRGAPAAPAARVDCDAYCGRLYLCFDAFLGAASPGGAKPVQRLRASGAYERARRTLLGACLGECRRARYAGAAARSVNTCLRAPTCAAFGQCAMRRLYSVDCDALCRRAWVTCLPDVLTRSKGLSRGTIRALRARGALSRLAARQYTACLAECKARTGHGSGALGLNLCLRRSACPAFADCLRGLLGPRSAAAEACARLYARYLRCRRIPITRGAFVDLCLRLHRRPHLQAELACAQTSTCPDFERCLRRVPAPRDPHRR